jgi:hypothetical protein
MEGSSMAISMVRIKKYRRWFGWGFVMSVPMLLALSTLGEPKFGAQILVCIGSLLTLIGFLVTTLITWRKEGRKSDHGPIELKKEKLDLETLRSEISKKNAAAQDKRNKTAKRKRIV